MGGTDAVMFIIKTPKQRRGVILLSLLLTLNMFHTLYC